jgi:hypothetical protein
MPMAMETVLRMATERALQMSMGRPVMPLLVMGTAIMTR